MLFILLDCALKGTVLLMVAFGGLLVLRRATAALRHWVWTVTLGGLLVLPVLSVVLPGWHVLPGWAGERGAVVEAVPARVVAPPPGRVPVAGDPGVVAPSRVPEGVVVPRGPVAAVPVTPAPARGGTFTWSALSTVLMSVYLLGVVVAMVPVALGYWVLRRLSGAAAEAGAEWMGLVAELKGTLGVARGVRVLIHPGRVMPMTWAIVRPVILLPADAESWPLERRRCVLLHELAHIKRGDALTFLLARVVCAAYWFHPLAWLAAGRLRGASELACDDLVVAAGTKSSTYAADLVSIAEGVVTPLPAVSNYAAIAMARPNRPSQIHARIAAILDRGRNRRRMTLGTVVGCLVVIGGMLLPLACMRSQNPPAEFVATDTPRFVHATLEVHNIQYGEYVGAYMSLGAPGSGKFGQGGAESEVSWKFLRSTATGDLYHFTRRFPADTDRAQTTEKEVFYGGKELTVFEDAVQRIVITPGQTASGAATQAHTFQLRRLLPEADLATAADEFPDPAHPGQKLRLAKTPIIDESALNSAHDYEGIFIDLTDDGSKAVEQARNVSAPGTLRAVALIDGQILSSSELHLDFPDNTTVYITAAFLEKDRATVLRFINILNTLVFQRPGAIVRGQVVDKPGGKGVANVSVTIALADNGNTSLTTSTDSQGVFQFQNVPHSGQSYFFRYDGQTSGDRVDLYISPNDIGKTKLVTLCQQLQTITGRVLDVQTHEPVPLAEINSDTTAGVLGGSTVSDAQGIYHLRVLPRTVSISSHGTTDSYLPVSREKRVIVGEGQNLENVDIELERMPSVEFDVVVLDPAGKPVANAAVEGRVNFRSPRDNDMSPPVIAMAAPSTDLGGRVHAILRFPGWNGRENAKVDFIDILLTARSADQKMAASLTTNLMPRIPPKEPLTIHLIETNLPPAIPAEFRFIGPDGRPTPEAWEMFIGKTAQPATQPVATQATQTRP